MTVKNFHHAELFIGDAHNTDVPFFGKDLFDSDNMNVRIFPAVAVTHINGKLEHLEAVFQDVFTELRVDLTLCLGFRRKVEKYQYPQYSICV